MKKVLFVLLGLCAVMRTSMCALTPVCTPATSPPQVAIPSFLETSYRAEISAKILEKKASAYGFEVFDSAARRSALSYTYHNFEIKQVTDLEKNTSYYMFGDKCIVEKFDDLKLTNNGQNMQSIKSALAIGGNSVYKGNTTIRGIPVQQWQFCNSQRGGNVTFTNDVYLATTEWLNPSGVPPPFPVRFDIQGKWINLSGSEENFHNIYDFVNFEKYQGSKHSAVFELPPEVQCSNIPQDVTKWPSVSSSVSTSIQTIRQGQVFEGSLFYDTKQQLSLEMVYAKRNLYFNSKDIVPVILVKVRDFNEGVVYSFDSSSGVCEIFPFNHVFDASKEDFLYSDNFQSDHDGYIHMSSVQHMFGMEGNFSYSGLHQVRGVWCDTYYREVQNYNGQPGPSTIGFFFAANTTTSNTLGKNNTTYNQLMRRTIYNGLMNEIQDYYNYDSEPMPITNPFDVNHCFSDSDKLPFILTFDPQPLPPRYRSSLAKAITWEIVSLTNVGPIRCHWEIIETVKGVPSLRGILLEKIKDYKKFAKVPGKVINLDSLSDYKGMTTLVTVNTADNKKPMTVELCASICAREKDVTMPASLNNKACIAFDQCDNGKSCTFQILGTAATRKDNYLKDSNSCDHYQKLIEIITEPTLSEAWKSIKDVVDAGKFRIPFIIDGKDVVFAANTITDLRQDLDTIGDSDSPLRNFILARGVELNKGLHLSHVDLTDCATSCQGNKAFQCETFTYCDRTAVCLLSSERPLGYQLDNPKSKICDSYIRTYLTDFSKIEGTTVLTSANSVYQALDNVEDCAKMCIGYTGFHCESFEFCTDRGGTCLIGRTHIYDISVSDNTVTPTCTHYSRNYLSDFRMTNTTGITKSDSLQEVSDVTAAQCAKMCISDGGDSCYGFYYSSSIGVCKFPVPDSLGSTLMVVDFTFYERMSSPQSNTNSQTQSDYSAGEMTGAAFGSIALGIVTALLALFLFGKIRRRPNTNIPVSFTPGIDSVKSGHE